MMKNITTILLILAFIPGILLPNSPFGLGQNMKKPDFGMPEKKDKKGPHKNKLALKPLAELKEGLERALQENDYETATKYLDALRMVCTDTEELKNILLQLADLYYKREAWSKAEKAYQEFVMLYPGADKYQYAYTQAAKCGQQLTAEPDRDQTKTQEVLKFCQDFIDSHQKSEYLDTITQIATQCREKLLASDVNVFNFYLNNKNYKAAQKRLDIISKEHVPQLPSAEPKTLELTIQLAQAQNNPQNLLDAQFKLVSKYPDNDVTKNLIAYPEQIKLAWEDAYKVKQQGQMPEAAKTLLAEAQSTPQKTTDLDLQLIAKDPLKRVERPKVQVAQAKNAVKTA